MQEIPIWQRLLACLVYLLPWSQDRLLDMRHHKMRVSECGVTQRLEYVKGGQLGNHQGQGGVCQGNRLHLQGLRGLLEI